MIVQKQRGFSVIELMVAMVIGLVLLAGALSIFFSSRVTFSTNEQMSRIQENGRVALDLVTHDIRSAGYNGCSRGVPFTNALNAPTSLRWNYTVPVQGAEWTGPGTWAPALGVTLTPASVNQSDVIVVRAIQRDARESRLVSDLATLTSALTVVNEPTFTTGRAYLISDCNAASVFQGAWTAGTPNGTMTHAAGGSGPGNLSAELGYLFQAGARIVPLETVIYWVGVDPVTTEPALYRQIGTATPQLLIEGVQAIQISYGEDTNGDRIVNFYRAANTVVNWNAIISVNVSLLMRSEEWGTNRDNRTYAMLPATDGGLTIAAANDRRQRMLFTTSIALRNRAW
jgi:type IV pilus assembly protein PilW